MPPNFTGPTSPCPRCASVAKMLRLSLADLRRAGYELFGRDLRSQPIIAMKALWRAIKWFFAKLPEWFDAWVRRFTRIGKYDTYDGKW